ncbi:hypothetical protein FNV43_RR04083 [Rhamnella rubrinervis]|uniref:Uncharacterized protein n=1 Tax=Rhamnella rubrinervis TaxID=2594499 RepID=A0A8K0HJ44_9ROSA|nr:hypothetical protein FNV43_RR04083 [Rhamnella rubrinervis]
MVLPVINISIFVGPDTAADITNAILNGLEIMKISNEVGSLDGLSSVRNLFPSSPSKNKEIGIIVGCVTGSVAVLAVIGLCYCCLAA